MALYEKLNETARAVLDPTEDITAATPVRVTDEDRAGVAAAGFAVGESMALAVTNRRLLLVEISPVRGFGVGGEFKEVLGELRIEEIVHMKFDPHLLSKDITVDLGETQIRFQAPAFSDARDVETAYVTAKAARPGKPGA